MGFRDGKIETRDKDRTCVRVRSKLQLALQFGIRSGSERLALGLEVVLELGLLLFFNA